MRHVSRLAVSLFALSLFASGAFPCSTFCAKAGGPVLFGKNYDWVVSAGLVTLNRAGVSKRSSPDGPAVSWVSKYGSVTFNQYGLESPMGGMNEAGLAIEIMWLDETEYPEPDGRAGIGSLGWVQYQLDNCATVEEVLATDGRIRIADRTGARVHYLVGDRSGKAAAVEFLDGEMVAHTGETMPLPVLTNDTYETSLTHTRERAGFGGSLPIGKGAGSLERFSRAAIGLGGICEGTDPVENAFGVLSSVSQAEWTVWSIVYDLRDARVHFRTASNPNIREIDLGALDFGCASPPLVFDVDEDYGDGDPPPFRPCTYEMNRGLLETAVRGTPFAKDIPAETLDEIARFPESFRCAD